MAGLNRLRMRPSDGGTQRTEHFDVRVAPEVLRHEHHDLFGNHVVEVLAAASHQELTPEVAALVATSGTATSTVDAHVSLRRLPARPAGRAGRARVRAGARPAGDLRPRW